MKSADSISFEILGFYLTNREVDVFDWASFVLLLFLHLFLGDL